MLQSKPCGIGDSPGKALEQSIDKGTFVAETGDERQVGIHRFPRFAPAHECHAADETEPPTLSLAKLLQLQCAYRPHCLAFSRSRLASASTVSRAPGAPFANSPSSSRAPGVAMDSRISTARIVRSISGVGSSRRSRRR